MNHRYRVEFESRFVTPITVEAATPEEAIVMAAQGLGEAGQGWYEEAGSPKVRLLEDDS
jgi:hypothetical protein